MTAWKRLAIVLTVIGLSACAQHASDATTMPAADTLMPSPANLLANPGFENDNPPFADWVLSTHADPEAFTFVLDDRVFKEGQVSLRIERRKDEPYASAGQFFDLGDLPTQRYRLSAWVKGEQLDAPVFLHAIYYAFGSPFDRAGGPEDGLKGSFDWTRLDLDVAMPERAKRVWVGIQTTGDGRLWIDAVTMVPIEE